MRQRTADHEERVARSSVHGLVGYTVTAVGLMLLFLGWYGVSGQSLVAKQLPYVASASLPGVALTIAGAVLVATDLSRRTRQRETEMLSTLYGLLTEAVTALPEVSPNAPEAVPVRRDRLVTLPGGTRFHRGDCILVDGKPGSRAIDGATIAREGLQPCPVCEPRPIDG